MRTIAGMILIGVMLAMGAACSSSEPPPQLNPGKAMRAAFAASLQVSAAQISQAQNVRGQLPAGDGVQILSAAGIAGVPATDPWGGEIRFHSDGTHWTLSSAGPDLKWDTPDDIVIEDGQLK